MSKNENTGIALDDLYAVIESRKDKSHKESYTAKLLKKGRGKICQKLGEEAVETVIAALDETPMDVVSESADLLYHLLVLWADVGVKPEAVWEELRRREGLSGVIEKKQRKRIKAEGK